MNTPTSETDKAKKLRSEYVSNLPPGIFSGSGDLAEQVATWRKNAPPNGWDTAAKLERERDEALIQLNAWQNLFGSRQLSHAISERDQLRKVCDELAKAAIAARCSGAHTTALGAELFRLPINSYNSLPHVIAAKKGNEV